MKKNIVSFGELLIRLSPPQHQRISQANSFNSTFGGSEANVAVCLSNFEMPLKFITRLPENALGESAVATLHKHKIDTSGILWGGNRIGLYYLEEGAGLRSSKVIYDRANSSMSELQPGMVDWNAIFKEASWFHWSGITPAISKNAALVCMEALEAARKKGVTISVDLNYRKNLWQYGSKPNEIMPALVEKCDVIIGGANDTTTMLGIEKADPSIQDLCLLWKKRFPNAQKIIMSERTIVNFSHNNYQGFLFDGKDFYSTSIKEITNIVDRVGTGDAFTAGLIYGLLNFPEKPQQIVDFGVASAALKHTIPGDFNLVSVEEVEQFLNTNGSSGIIR